MKKILIILTIITLLCGCNFNIENISNTPTKQVEEYLNNYQKLTSEVLSDLELVVERENDFNTDQKEKYKDLMKRNFKNMAYKIKDETVNGDNAMVEVEITVYDFYIVISSADNYLDNNIDEFTKEDGNIESDKFIDYKLDRMEKNTDKVKYTIYFNLSKNEKGKWIMDEVSESDEEKILGIYEY